MHGLDCRQLELFGKTHALLLQLAAGCADALSDLRARALILTAGFKADSEGSIQGRRDGLPFRFKADATRESGGEGEGIITGSLMTGMHQWWLWCFPQRDL